MKDKNTCILYGDMIEYTEGDDALSDAQIAMLFKAQLAYINGRDVVVADAEVKGIWRMVKSRIDRDNNAYAERCKKASESVKKRWEQKETYTNNTNACEDIPSIPKAISENNDIISSTKANIVEPEIKATRKKKAKTDDVNEIISSYQFDNEVFEAVSDWLKYKSERHEKYQTTGLKKLLTQIQNNVAQYGAQRVVDVINTSMASNYVGILWTKLGEQPKRNQSVANKVSDEYLKRWGLA